MGTVSSKTQHAVDIGAIGGCTAAGAMAGGLFGAAIGAAACSTGLELIPGAMDDEDPVLNRIVDTATFGILQKEARRQGRLETAYTEQAIQKKKAQDLQEEQKEMREQALMTQQKMQEQERELSRQARLQSLATRYQQQQQYTLQKKQYERAQAAFGNK